MDTLSKKQIDLFIENLRSDSIYSCEKKAYADKLAQDGSEQATKALIDMAKGVKKYSGGFLGLFKKPIKFFSTEEQLMFIEAMTETESKSFWEYLRGLVDYRPSDEEKGPNPEFPNITGQLSKEIKAPDSEAFLKIAEAAYKLGLKVDLSQAILMKVNLWRRLLPEEFTEKLMREIERIPYIENWLSYIQEWPKKTFKNNIEQAGCSDLLISTHNLDETKSLRDNLISRYHAQRGDLTREELMEEYTLILHRQIPDQVVIDSVAKYLQEFEGYVMELAKNASKKMVGVLMKLADGYLRIPGLLTGYLSSDEQLIVIKALVETRSPRVKIYLKEFFETKGVRGNSFLEEDFVHVHNRGALTSRIEAENTFHGDAKKAIKEAIQKLETDSRVKQAK